MSFRTFLAVTGAAVLISAPVVSAATVQFSFDYSGDAAGEGFNDPTLGASRRAALQAAANVWGQHLTATYAGETILVQATFDPLGGNASSATLGQAGGTDADANFSHVSSKYASNTVYLSALANHLHGSDMNGATSEITAQFNSDIDSGTLVGGKTFYYGTDANPGSNKVDFETVAVHELTHGLGFGDDIDPSTGAFLNGDTLPDAYDRHLYRKSANQFLTARTDAQRLSDITSGDVYFRGTDTTGLTGTDTKVYAPGTYQSGSSISHVDDATYPGDIMDHIYPAANHTPSSQDLAVLSDIGWDVVGVPEPTALAPVALAALTVLPRRRRRGRVAVAAC